MRRISCRRIIDCGARRSNTTTTTAPPQLSLPQERYINALRTTLSNAPREGLTIPTFAANLSKVLGEDSDPTRFGFDRIIDALLHVNDLHYVVKKERIVPCDWSTVVNKLRNRLPCEGVLLPTLVRYVCNECPHFDQTSFPGLSVAQWMQSRFPGLISVTTSKSDPTQSIFRPVASSHYESDAEVAVVNEALAQLGRPAVLPTFTSLAALLPLLPGPTDPVKKAVHWHGRFLQSRALRDSFDIDLDVTFTTPPGALQLRKTHVFVDGTSLSVVELPLLLEKHRAALSSVIEPLDTDAGSSYTIGTKLFQHASTNTSGSSANSSSSIGGTSSRSSPAASGATIIKVPDAFGVCEVCVMDSFLDATESFATEIALATASGSGRCDNEEVLHRMCLFCGDTAFDAMVAMAREMKANAQSLVVCSPSRCDVIRN